jgi:hypothetical protein
MSSTTVPPTTSVQNISNKYTEEELKILNSIKSENKTNKIINILVLTLVLLVVFVPIILKLIFVKTNSDIRIYNNKYSILLIFLLLCQFSVAVYNLIRHKKLKKSYSNENNKLIEWYKKTITGSNSYYNLQNPRPRRVYTANVVTDYIIDKNYFGAFNDVLDMSEIKLNYKLGVANIVLSSIFLFVTVLLILDAKKIINLG